MPRFAVTIIFFLFSFCRAQAQPDDFDYHILRKMEAHRTPAKTAFFKFVSKWNNPVCLAAPASLFVTGLIRNDSYMKKSALDVTESIFVSSLVNTLLKKLFNRKRPFIHEITFTAVPEPGAWAMTLIGLAGVGATLRASRRKRSMAVG